MSSVLPWSYSKLSDYQLCPRQYYAKHIAKTAPFEESEAIIWGNRVHKALELRLTEGASLEEGMTQYEPIMQSLEAMAGDKYCELQLAVTAELTPADFFDNAYAWNRGVEDLVIIQGKKAASMDYKTGKKNPKSKQLALSAGRIFVNFPEVQAVETAFLWLKEFPKKGWMTQQLFYRHDFEEQWRYFQDEVKDMEWSLKNNTWPAKPNGLCRAWCPDYSCPHNGRRK